MVTLTHEIEGSRITVHSRSDVLKMTSIEQKEHFKELQKSSDGAINRLAELLTGALANSSSEQKLGA
ncbi:hypothetical protein [Tumebacillus permanentifrigoris]|uniref:Uncharacterized protein n=1 Tax=Tumebacillus permanentifrigoris TaxID=378543 RepID=A0A316D367_9BACL|nr:hypothetical protein [Tumebacillus permanentifrigoris]PWK05280.1 hypothetical protein C7459_12429 [Tumebacillus permanentifrigoris]